MMSFDYGDEVLARSKPCVVVGMTQVDNEALARKTGYPIGAVLCTVEFGEGSEALVPHDALRLLN